MIDLLTAEEMAGETYPRGTHASRAKGLVSMDGPKPFVHVTDEEEFYVSFPQWVKKNSNINHVYEFRGKLVEGHQAHKTIEQTCIFID